MVSKTKAFVLPASVIGPADVARLKRDLETFDDQLHQASLRTKAVGKQAPVSDVTPKQLIMSLAAANKSDLDDRSQRQNLIGELDGVLTSAPTITISFAIDPSSEFLSKIVQWLRTNTQPNVLVRIGLQPNIVAGCRLRTANKLYDFSLRNKFDEQRPLLISRLKKSTHREPTLKAPSVEPAT